MRRINISGQRIPLLILLALLTGRLAAQQLTATDIVKKANDKLNGEKSGYSLMTMTIIRPAWQRSVEFKSWSMGSDYDLTLITSPAREKGQTFLKRKNEMWSFNPAISRLIKLPPSMMSQGWMGSDYTNDDILRESSVVNDYTHTVEGEEEIAGTPCYRIKLLAKPDADVIWGYQIWWVDKKESIVLKAELYDEDGILVRTETGKELKRFDGRLLPSVIELVPAEPEGNKTVLKITELKFNINLEESFFSQQNMKTVR
jgi:outer membrane lipoprotein-sorting protein